MTLSKSWLTAFDMTTMAFIYLLVTYMATYVMAVTWRQSRKRVNGIGWFALYFGFIALGISLTLIRNHLPALITIVGANTLMFWGQVHLLKGISRFLDLDIRLKPYAALCLALVGLYTWFTLYAPDIARRIILFSAFSMVPLGHGIFLIFFRTRPDQYRAAWNTGSTLALFFPVYLGRIYFALKGPVPETYFSTPMADSFFQILGLCLTMLFTLSLHLMINATLVNQAEDHARAQEKLAARDSLTGLLNRRKMGEHLEESYYRFQRYDRPFSVILCDIDHFKQVNDTWGHDAGDRVLKAVAAKLRNNIRPSDQASRWGGEEFLILLPETREPGAVKTAEKLRQQITVANLDIGHSGTPLTLSFGVAQSGPGLDLTQVLKNADQALYRAKDTGRNRVVSVGITKS